MSAILFSVKQCAVTPKLQENSLMYTPGAAFIKVMMDSPKRNSLFRFFSTSDKTKEIQRKQKQELNVSEKETEEELSAIALAKKKTQTEAECSEPTQNEQI